MLNVKPSGYMGNKKLKIEVVRFITINNFGNNYFK